MVADGWEIVTGWAGDGGRAVLVIQDVVGEEDDPEEAEKEIEQI